MDTPRTALAPLDHLPEEGVVVGFIESDDPYPIDFDSAWKWLGYANRDAALKAFRKSGVLEGLDFRPVRTDEHAKHAKTGRGRRPLGLRLALTGLKRWGMQAGTTTGERVRDYFLEVERRYLATLRARALEAAEADELRRELAALYARRDAVPRSPWDPAPDAVESPAECAWRLGYRLDRTLTAQLADHLRTWARRHLAQSADGEPVLVRRLHPRTARHTHCHVYRRGEPEVEALVAAFCVRKRLKAEAPARPAVALDAPAVGPGVRVRWFDGRLRRAGTVVEQAGASTLVEDDHGRRQPVDPRLLVADACDVILKLDTARA